VKLYPAIDILGGKAVRLVKGDFAARTIYDEDPLEAAWRWTKDGAEHLHVVDLDGAERGEPANLEHLGRIAGLGVPVQYGGGLRSIEAIEGALAAADVGKNLVREFQVSGDKLTIIVRTNSPKEKQIRTLTWERVH